MTFDIYNCVPIVYFLRNVPIVNLIVPSYYKSKHINNVYKGDVNACGLSEWEGIHIP